MLQKVSDLVGGLPAARVGLVELELIEKLRRAELGVKDGVWVLFGLAVGESNNILKFNALFRGDTRGVLGWEILLASGVTERELLGLVRLRCESEFWREVGGSSASDVGVSGGEPWVVK